MSDEVTEITASDEDIHAAHELLDELANAKAELKGIKARHDAVKTRLEQAQRKNPDAYRAAEAQRSKK